MLVGYITISVASYTFRPLIVAIFREVFSEGVLHRTLKNFTDITCHYTHLTSPNLATEYTLHNRP